MDMRNYIYRLLKTLLMINAVICISTGAIIAKPVAILTFVDSATINDTAIYIRDIAVISADSPELKERLSATVAGSIAPPGCSRFISTADLLLYRLQPEFKDIDFRVVEHRRISVKTVGIVRKAGDYSSVIESCLGRYIDWKQGEWSVDIENPEETFKCLDLPLDVWVEGFSAIKTTFPRGHIRLELVVTQKGLVVRIPVSCMIKVSAPVAVSKQAIPRGKVIDSNDIEMRSLDISAFGPDPWYKTDGLPGQKAIRNISRGSILFDRLLEPVPVVSKGDILSIRVMKGNVTISVSAIARENGSSGRKIWAENATTHKLVRVIIKDKNTAIVL